MASNLSNDRARAVRYVRRLENEVKKSKSATVRIALRNEIQLTQAAIDRSYKNYQTRLAAQGFGAAVGQNLGKTTTGNLKTDFQRGKSAGRTIAAYERRAKAAGKLSFEEASQILSNVPSAGGKGGKSPSVSVNEISTRFFQEQINLASRGKSSAIGRAHRVVERKGVKNPTGMQKVRIFYRSTQRFWEGRGGLRMRDENIVKGLQERGFDVKNLAEAWDVVMSQNADVLDYIRQSRGDIGGLVEDTEESRSFQMSVGNSKASGSPDWFDKIYVFS